MNLAPQAFPELARVPYLGRLATFNPVASDSVAGRLMLWPAAASLAAERPLTGYGPDTLYTVFSLRYPPELVSYLGRDADVDRAHNYFLDLALSSGIPAALAALGLLGLLVFTGLRLLWRSQDRGMQLVSAGYLAAILGYLAQNQFSFWTVETEAIFWLLAAAVVALSRPALTAPARARPSPRRRARRPRPPYLGVGRGAIYLLIGAVTAAVILGTNLRPALADVYLAQAIAEKDPQRAIAGARTAATLGPFWAEPRFFLSGRHLAQAMRSQDKLPFLEQAEAEMKQTLALVPGYYQYWAALGQLYAYWGSEVDRGRFADAHAAYQQALALFPHGALVWVGVGDLYQNQGEAARAEESYRRALELDAEQSLAHEGLAQLYLSLGDRGRAIQELVNATILEPKSASLWNFLGKLYLEEGRLEEAAQAFLKAQSFR